MKKYLFLSSAFLMTMAGANAADKIITSANTCTVDVLGVSDNNAVANTIATWDLIDYTLNPGQYLNVTETSVDKTTCPAGSYCVGGGFTVETANNSIAQCPTGYPNSANGASADTQCYTACTVATANIAHATAVGGNDYFGDGADACYATACDKGYHVDGGGVSLVEKDPLVPISLTARGAGYRSVNADGRSYSEGTVDAIPADSVTAPNTWATAFGDGIVYGKASCQPATNNAAIAYVISNYQSVLGGGMTIEAFKSGLEPIAGSVLTDYAADILLGLMKGTKTEKDMYEAMHVVFGTKKDANYSTDSVGEYCYCQMDGFMPTGGTREIVTSAPWVFNNAFSSADNCPDGCADNCAYSLRDDKESNLAFRAAAVGALEAVETGGICAANTINIDWNPDNGGEHTINQCTYEGSIELPTPDPVKPGYTFTGWKLVE